MVERESVPDLVCKIVEARPTNEKRREPPDGDAVAIDPADAKHSLTGKVGDEKYIERIRFPQCGTQRGCRGRRRRRIRDAGRHAFVLGADLVLRKGCEIGTRLHSDAVFAGHGLEVQVLIVRRVVCGRNLRPGISISVG